MNLHLNEDFKHIIEEISESTKINNAIIEKDYFVTLFLKKLVEKDDKIIFKGGTSLSKC
jgi:predicted nucleotidyltransferase component of viral defense system